MFWEEHESRLPNWEFLKGQGSEKSLCSLVINLAHVPSALLSPGHFHVGLNSHVARGLLGLVWSYLSLEEPGLLAQVQWYIISLKPLISNFAVLGENKGTVLPSRLVLEKTKSSLLTKSTPQQVHWCLILWKDSYSHIQFRCTTQ